MRVGAARGKELPFKPERKHIIGHDGVGPVLFALAIGSIGGFIFNWLKMPLAWMLGSCLFTTIAAFAGLRVGMRVRLRERGFAVRRGETFPGLGADWIRIAVRDEETTDTLIKTLRAIREES